MKKEIAGNIVAIVTPFNRNGKSIDYESHANHIDWLIKNGVDGIVTVGTTGESATLSFKEHENVMRFVYEFVNKRVPVIAGIGGNNTREAVHLTNIAKKIGVDAGLSVTPYYNKPPQEGLCRHFINVCEAAEDLPIILYNVPSRTGVDLKPETVFKITDRVKNVIGIKEASSNLKAVAEYVSHDVPLFCGEDAMNLPMLLYGAVGVISVVSNFDPRIVSKLIHAYRKTDIEVAKSVNYEMVRAAEKAFVQPNPIPAKYLCARLGLIKHDAVRLPLVSHKELDPEIDEKINGYIYTLTH